MKKTILLLFLCSLLFGKGMAQTYADKNYYLVDSLDLSVLTKADRQLVDSCLKAFHAAKEDTSKVSVINYIVEESLDDNLWPKYNRWTYNFVQEKIANRPPPPVVNALRISLASALNNIGYIYKSQGQIKEALDYYGRSLSIYKEIGDKQGIATSLNSIGLIYNAQGQIKEALDYFGRSLSIQEEIGDKKGIATSLNNIGLIYNAQGQIKEALEYWGRSLSIREEIGGKEGIANSLNNIGGIYNDQGQIKEALEYYGRCLSIQEEIGDKKGIATSLNNIGYIYRNQGQIKEALDYYGRSLSIREQIGDKKGIASSLNNIAGVLLQQGKVGEALASASCSMQIAKELGYPENIKNAASILKNIYKKQNKYKDAMEMYALEIQMRDSIQNIENEKASIKQQTKYEYEKQKAVSDAKHNANMEKTQAIAQADKKRQNIIIASVSVGLGLVVLFSVFLFNRFKVTQRQRNEIDSQKQVVEATLLQVELQKEHIEEVHKEITDSINYAERIQRSFLATKEDLDANLNEYFVFFRPKDVVSGDFYSADKLPNGDFAIVNADSTGHGVPGAIMSILNITSLEMAVTQGIYKPAEIFNYARKTIVERLKKDGSADGGKDGMDASIVCFNAEKTKLSYCAAQNPIWIIRSGEIIEIKPEKMPVGKHDNDGVPFVGGEIDLQKGDIVYTLTDGFQDQFGGPSGKKFKVKKMREYMLSISHLTMQEQYQKIDEVFSTWKGDLEQVDDVCVIGVKI